MKPTRTPRFGCRLAAGFGVAALAAAGFAGEERALLTAKRATAPADARTLAVTVDDLPATPAADLAEMRRITKGVLEALKKHRAPAIGFVNESKLEPAIERKQRLALLRQWLDAGHELGNHTYSHADLQTLALADYERDVMRGEQETRRLEAERGLGVRFFRHPYTHTGPTLETRAAFEAFLIAHGYAIAPFSIENSDYIFDLLRQQAAARRDRAASERLRSAYVEHTIAVTEYMETLARDTFGRAIPQVLLVHANATNAEALGDVLARLAARGYRFVGLDDALADEAWSTPDRYVGPYGPSWLHRFQLAKGRPVRIDLEPDPPQWVLDLYHAAQPR